MGHLFGFAGGNRASPRLAPGRRRGAGVLLLLCCLAQWAVAAEPCPSRVRELRPVPVAAAGQVTVATQNLWRLFDDIDDGNGEVVTHERYRQHLDKLARQIAGVLQAPDVVAVQEAESRKVLADLAAAVQARDPARRYRAVLLEGHDRSGIDVGFLVRADWTLRQARQLFADRRHNHAWLFDRPPLWLQLETPRGQRLDLVNVHLRSLIGSDAGGAEGRRVARKRRRQAELLAGWVQAQLAQQPGTPLVLLGDFNASPGAARGLDVLGLLQQAGLNDLVLRLPPAERWTYVHACRAEALDHIMVSPALLPAVAGIAVSRGNAGVYWRRDREPGTALRSSDHDGLELYLHH